MMNILNREISKMEFSEKDILSSKSFSRFLVKLSELLPKEMLKQMVLLQNQLDAEVSINSFPFRLKFIDAFENINFS